MDLSKETQDTLDLLGIEIPTNRRGRNCLLARRLVG